MTSLIFIRITVLQDPKQHQVWTPLEKAPGRSISLTSKSIKEANPKRPIKIKSPDTFSKLKPFL